MIRLFGALVLVSLVGFVPRATPAPMELWAFTGPWDTRSDSSLRANARRIDVAVTGWIGLDSSSAMPILPSIYPDTLRLPGVRRMALVTSWHGSRFHPRSVRTLASDDARRAHVARAIARHAVSMHYEGLVLDFEGMEAADLPALLGVVKAITDTAHAHGVATIVVAIPALDRAAYPAAPIARVADLVMPMLYDQHWSTSGPGSISAPAWVRSALAQRVAEVGASRIVAALPTYGYQWGVKAGAPANVVSLADARRLAGDSHVRLARDASTSTMRAVKPGAWEIWVTDAGLLAQLAREANAAGVHRIALWRIGTEDGSVWRSLGR